MLCVENNAYRIEAYIELLFTTNRAQQKIETGPTFSRKKIPQGEESRREIYKSTIRVLSDVEALGSQARLVRLDKLIALVLAVHDDAVISCLRPENRFTSERINKVRSGKKNKVQMRKERRNLLDKECSCKRALAIDEKS